MIISCFTVLPYLVLKTRLAGTGVLFMECEEYNF